MNKWNQDWHSFKQLLRRYLKENKPKKILEWGPGESTNIIINICPNSNIISIEHNEKWYNIAKEEFKEYNNIKIIYKEINKNTKYATKGYDNSPYDFIFIDGRRRVECAIIALQTIKKDGVIMLHDSNRTNYTKPLNPYIDKIEEKDDTLVFKPNEKNIIYN